VRDVALDRPSAEEEEEEGFGGQGFMGAAGLKTQRVCVAAKGIIKRRFISWYDLKALDAA
jgi:hypothetical protein